MNEHLPECPVEKRLRTGRTVGSQACICAALRACEDRVSRASHEAGYAAGYGAGMDDGWGEPGHIKAALDAAVKRVEDYLQHDVADGWMPRSKAEGIITVLKGEQ